MQLENKVLKLDIDLEILAEVIGETKMQVTVFIPATVDEDIDSPTPLETNNEVIDDEYNYKSSIIKEEKVI